MLLVGGLILAGAFGLYKWGLATGTGIAQARTLAVTAVVMIEIFYLLNCRSLDQSIFRIGPFSNPWVLAGVPGLLALQVQPHRELGDVPGFPGEDGAEGDHDRLADHPEEAPRQAMQALRHQRHADVRVRRHAEGQREDRHGGEQQAREFLGEAEGRGDGVAHHHRRQRQCGEPGDIHL